MMPPVLKAVIGMAVKSGFLDGFFSSIAESARGGAGHIAAFASDVGALHRYRRAQGDEMAAGDFRSFFSAYLNACLRDAMARHPIPAADAANMAAEILLLLSTVPPAQWSAALRDPQSFSAGPVGQRFIPFGQFVSGALSPVFYDVVETVREDVAVARTWLNSQN
jgi:hypothetical protein